MKSTRAVAAEELAGAEKRRKVSNGELKLRSSTLGQITTDEDSCGPCAAAASLSCDHIPLSCCSCNGSTQELPFTDLEGSVEIGTFKRYNRDTGARTPRCEFKARSGVVEKITRKRSTFINSRSTVPTEKTPPAAELEEFFASAEKHLHKCFKDKYNFDAANDTPLKGRFEWVELKP